MGLVVLLTPELCLGPRPSSADSTCSRGEAELTSRNCGLNQELGSEGKAPSRGEAPAKRGYPEVRGEGKTKTWHAGCRAHGRGRGGLGQGVDGGAGRPLLSAGESRFAGFDDVNNSVIAAFGTRNAMLVGEWEDAHGNARVCACSRLEATPAIVISRQCVRLRACVPSEGPAYLHGG